MTADPSVPRSPAQDCGRACGSIRCETYGCQNRSSPPVDLPVLPVQVAAALRAWHDDYGYECVAHSEGQACCVDLLLDRVGRDFTTRIVTKPDGLEVQAEYEAALDEACGRAGALGAALARFQDAVDRLKTAEAACREVGVNA